MVKSAHPLEAIITLEPTKTKTVIHLSHTRMMMLYNTRAGKTNMNVI